ncbi:MAG: DUF58 domain-containing protein [Acidimicrobiia bacterium]|nr:DUF58 domain-containing protein [Acidimicrobiia bacterium]
MTSPAAAATLAPASPMHPGPAPTRVGSVVVRQRPVALVLWVVAGGALLGALAWRSPLLVGMAAVAVVLVWNDRRIARDAVVTAEVELTPPIEVASGAPVAASLRVHGLRRPVVLRLPHRLGSSRLLVRDSSLCGVVLPATYRGVRTAMIVDVAASGPLGLADGIQRHLVRFNRPLVVVPAALDHEVRWPPRRSFAIATEPSNATGDDLVRSIRPYRRGDSPRRVHWKATAHHGSLMVTESDGLGVPMVRIVVSYGYLGPDAELAVQRAHWAAAEALGRGWRVRLVSRQPVGDVPVPIGTVPAPGPHGVSTVDGADPTAPFDLYAPVDAQRAVHPTSVRDEVVRHPRHLRRLLASVGPGPVPTPATGPVTRWIADTGDRWL